MEPVGRDSKLVPLEYKVATQRDPMTNAPIQDFEHSMADGSIPNNIRELAGNSCTVVMTVTW